MFQWVDDSPKYKVSSLTGNYQIPVFRANRYANKKLTFDSAGLKADRNNFSPSANIHLDFLHVQLQARFTSGLVLCRTIDKRKRKSQFKQAEKLGAYAGFDHNANKES